MKKAANSTPDRLLKVERELRGWSQKYVADRIGADHYYLSPWEHGTASPSPYYRQKLCTLFGKNAKDLGLLRAALDEQGQPATARHEPPADSAGALLDPAIPPLTVAATGLIGRGEVLFQLRERLCAGKNLALTALNGLPGVGKTTLAVSLAHHKEVQDYFSDGILWAAVGPQPSVLALLARWGTVLGVPAAEKVCRKTKNRREKKGEREKSHP